MASGCEDFDGLSGRLTAAVRTAVLNKYVAEVYSPEELEIYRAHLRRLAGCGGGGAPGPEHQTRDERPAPVKPDASIKPPEGNEGLFRAIRAGRQP